MEALVYFVIWGVFIFLMMRMGCGSHVMGHSHRHGGADAGFDLAATYSDYAGLIDWRAAHARTA